MPPSQLKRLKTSLREQGIVGPQQSKKQKKQNAQNGANKEKKIKRSVALSGIRDQFNPFEIKQAKAPKFEVTSNKTIGGRISKGIKKPGVARGLAEENRRKTLLVEMQSRNRVGGIIDKRFGENDPSMAPEDKMLERFTQEKQRGHKNSSAFDLEDDETPGELTHMGQSLSLDGPTIRDDFDDEGLELSDAEDHESDDERQARKRRRGSNSEGSDEDEEGTSLPERKKSKQEVMKELIAKSKMHKYERQAVKDDDEDLREELDKEMSGIHELLRGMVPKPPPAPIAPPADIPGMNPERIALMNGGDREKLEKEYDMRMRQMAQDKRSQPTERSKTEDEKMEQESGRLRELEAKRLRRMEGVVENSDEEEDNRTRGADDEEEDEEEEEEDYGLGAGIKTRPSAAELGADDEDDFMIDDGLVASGSDIDESEGESGGQDDESDNEDDEFLKGLLTEEEAKNPEFLTGANAPLPEAELPAKNGVNGDLAYTFPCPQSHEELLEVTKSIALLDLPTVIQRIRALYHPKLNSENKSKLGNFAVSLVSHISYLANQAQQPPFSVLENVIRHIHSLAKTFPLEIANTFRRHLEEINQTRPLSLNAGDLTLLTAIGTMFPTSDHFHQVVTPAVLTMGRYLGQKIPQTLSDYTMGTYLCTLCLQYQRLSKRYVPEVGGFIENTLCALAPTKLPKIPGCFPYHEPKSSVRIENSKPSDRQIEFYDCVSQELSADEEEPLKIALLETNIKILEASADLWTGKSAFTEVYEPALAILKHLGGKSCRSKLPESTQTSIRKSTSKLQTMLSLAHLARRPLELHHHKPLAIKTSIPKFEDSYNPDKHYDPDRERADTAKLRAEHKQERKGAMRELRKDSNFIARESLRQKKEKDAAHDKKMKRLVAEIQGEEGRESNAYEREKEYRKKGKN
ncbi:hypothetical protein SBOR_1629 [Sclerotinia borealis F-4128]|uniref:Nop14-like family protein n=1 Tax=Sclerotinia borealis (strain F-4128) TaxID=1432307 RepID=W9CPJ4_SCLBF|nr:hypothetical protein SBOR_1629 [Sclerotinia borealis F-4128]